MKSKEIDNQYICKNKLIEICTSLIDNPLDEDLGLLSGMMGQSMLLICYGKDSQEEAIYAAGIKQIEHVFERIDEGYFYTTFCKGLAGIGWGIVKLIESGYLDIDAEDFLDEIDDYLIRNMILDAKSGNYDFLHGASGIALYLLQRVKYKASKITPALEDFLAILYDGAIKTDSNTLKWNTLISMDPLIYGSNISLSHGSSSLLVIVSKIYEAGIATDLCKKLGNGIYNYILEQRLDEKYWPYCFPSFSKDSNPDFHESRLAWCYGDVGISTALWLSSKNFGQINQQNTAEEIMFVSTNRVNTKETKVFDAGFCHGSAGLAYIYQDMYKKTKKEAFLNSHTFWIDKTISLANHADGPGGFKMFEGTSKNTWINTYNVLEGVAGVGFVLASKYLKSNFWDEMFLIN